MVGGIVSSSATGMPPLRGIAPHRASAPAASRAPCATATSQEPRPARPAEAPRRAPGRAAEAIKTAKQAARAAQSAARIAEQEPPRPPALATSVARHPSTFRAASPRHVAKSFNFCPTPSARSAPLSRSGAPGRNSARDFCHALRSVLTGALTALAMRRQLSPAARRSKVDLSGMMTEMDATLARSGLASPHAFAEWVGQPLKYCQQLAGQAPHIPNELDVQLLKAGEAKFGPLRERQDLRGSARGVLDHDP